MVRENRLLEGREHIYGLPYPYTKKDAEEYIMSMLSADKTKTFALAIIVDDKVVGSIGVFR